MSRTLTDKSGKDIRGRTGTESDHNLDRVGGIGLCFRQSRARDQRHHRGCAKRGRFEILAEHTASHRLRCVAHFALLSFNDAGRAAWTVAHVGPDR
jgi:hypothetical protein